jgi:hypothetical protein
MMERRISGALDPGSFGIFLTGWWFKPSEKSSSVEI